MIFAGVARPSTTIRTRLKVLPLPLSATMSAEYWYDLFVSQMPTCAAFCGPSASYTQETSPLVEEPPVVLLDPLLALVPPARLARRFSASSWVRPGRHCKTSRGALFMLIRPVMVLAVVPVSLL